MKLLLIGANGQVGHELRRSLAPLGEVVATTREGRLADELFAGGRNLALDLEAADVVAGVIRQESPDIVVNAAAYTAVDRAEGEPQRAFRINAEAPGEMARACSALGIPLVHYSTDYVFDGTATRPYREDDPTGPINVYGASKLAGERAILASGCRHVILRTAWVYGLYGHNFLNTVLRLARERDELRIVADQFGSPTPAWLIADVTADLIARGLTDLGIRHLTAQGETSWHGFAEAIVQRISALGDATVRRVSVAPIPTTEYPTPARRPSCSALDCARLIHAGVRLPGWGDALQSTLQRRLA